MRAFGEQLPVTKRQLVAGVAWSVPAILSATAAPAYAASECPRLTVMGSIVPFYFYDQITVANSGIATWPVGTTITWTIRNLLPSDDRFQIRSQTGVTLQNSLSLTLAPGATGIFIFTTTAAIAVNFFARWQMSSSKNQYTYTSTVKVTVPGMSMGCSPEACISGKVNGAFGTVCA